MNVAEIRKKFIEFFVLKNHKIISSSSLIPKDDPTLMFTNSGMVQFKDIFLGLRKESYSRATSVQRCLRAGGKHNDLENVGYTARHHTFFEMLGNFSFGDYFKREAIHYAWELLTTVFKLPPEKLLVTVYYQDDEAFGIWTKEIGLPASRVIQINDNKGLKYASDNFWSMGDTGPCGPSSEIFYDHGVSVPGGPPGSAEENGDRFVEIWNLVFMQFNRAADGSMSALPIACVDTGMGLERIAAVLQNVKSNYDIDLFQRLIQAAATVTGCTDLTQNSLKVIADHIRSSVFMIADGIFPGNDGRNYVLRRIIRRAIRHGYQLGCCKPFFSLLVKPCVEEMLECYPSLHKIEEKIQNILLKEEERFFATLSQGMAILEEEIERLTKVNANKNGSLSQVVFPGSTAFKLHDTYGFPFDLTEDICRERGLTFDSVTFEKEMLKQKELARFSGKFKSGQYIRYDGEATKFTGYQFKESSDSVVKALYLIEKLDCSEAKSVLSLKVGQEGIVVLDVTPFYAEAGGQIGDSGILISKEVHFLVHSTFKIRDEVIGHQGIVQSGEMYLDQRLMARIDYSRRLNIARHHSSTHLLHFALRRTLGNHVEQKGSLVDCSHIRFDFSHPSPVTADQLRAIERCVNIEILLNSPTHISWTTFDEALSQGALALFGEKYSDEVRVVQLGSSVELCAGTHVQFTGEIGLFKILSESGVASGVRRIEAVSGFATLDFMQKQKEQIDKISYLLNCQVTEIFPRIELLFDQNKDLEKKLALLTKKNIENIVQQLKSRVVDVGTGKLLIDYVLLDDLNILRNIGLALSKDLGNRAVVVLATKDRSKANVVACVSESLSKKISANHIIMSIIKESGGKGGGKATMAQAGGVMAVNLPRSLNLIKSFVKEILNEALSK